MEHFKFNWFWLILSVAHASLDSTTTNIKHHNEYKAPQRNPRWNPIDIDFYYLAELNSVSQATDHEFDALQFSHDADQSPSTHLETKQPKATPCATSNFTNCNLFKATAFVMMVLLAGAFIDCSRYKLVSSFVRVLLLSFAIQATPTHAKLIAYDQSDTDVHYFSRSVSQYADIVAIGAAFHNEEGSVYMFSKTNNEWTKVQPKLTASDGAISELFGSVSSLHGDHLAIGAHRDDVDKGSVYMFSKTNDGWKEEQKLTAADGEIGDNFGQTVSVYGASVAIGAFCDDDRKGSVYVFSKTNDVWEKEQKITASDAAANDKFGYAVSLYGDSLAIGAIRKVYMFSKTNDGWKEEQKFETAAGFFGTAVSLYGTSVAVGAWSDLSSKGSVYMFSKTNDGWRPQQSFRLTAADGAANDKFGYAVSLYGASVAIGAYEDDKKGSVYMFSKTNDEWKQEQKLTADDGEDYEKFGYTVSLYGDSVAIGAIGDDGYKGSVYMFSKTNDEWKQDVQAPLLQYKWMHIIAICCGLICLCISYIMFMYYLTFMKPNRVTRYAPVKEVDSAAENDAIDIESH